MASEDVTLGEVYRAVLDIKTNMVNKDANDEVIRSLREDHRIDVQALADLRAEFAGYRSEVENVKKGRFNSLLVALLALASGFILKYFVPDIG